MLVLVVTISVKADAASTTDPLQPKTLQADSPLSPESDAPVNLGPGGSLNY